MSVEAALLALPTSSAPPSSGAPPGPAPPGGPPFQSALAEHWARTANAEGQQQQSATQSGTADGPANRPTHAEPRHAHGRASDVSNATSEAGTAAVSGAPAAAPAPTSSPAPTAAEERSTETGSTTPLASAAALNPSGAAISDGSAVPSLAGEVSEGATDASGLTEATTESSDAAAAVAQGAPGETPPSAEGSPVATAAEASTLAQELASSSTSTATAQGSEANPTPVAKPQTSTDPAEAGKEPAPAPAPAPGAPTATAPQTNVTTAPAAAPVSAPAMPPARTRVQLPTTTSSGQEAAGATVPVSDVHTQALGSHAGGEGSPEGDTGTQESPAAQTGAATSTTQSQALLEGPVGSTSVLTAALGEPLSATTPAVGSSAFVAATGPSAGSTGVDLQQMIESIHATVELAARQGASQARIALQPRDLGEIRIHLSQTSEGLLARVTADSAAAAQTLAGGRSELQQSLSSLGVSLLRLDIGSSGQPQTGEREGSSAGEARRSTTGGSSDSTEDGGLEQISQTTAGGLASGGLVDVLA